MNCDNCGGKLLRHGTRVYQVRDWCPALGRVVYLTVKRPRLRCPVCRQVRQPQEARAPGATAYIAERLRAEICRRLVAGDTIVGVGAALRIGKSTVSRIGQAAGVSRPRGRPRNRQRQ